MPCPYPSIALLRGRHQITALLFCLCCAGCIADRASAPEVKPGEIAAEARAATVLSNADATPSQAMVAVPATGTSAAAAHRAGSSAALLRSESALVFKEGISILAAENLLTSSSNMSDAIKRLSEEAASSPEVQDLTRHYRSALERAMAQEGVLEGFSCGLSICIGLVRSGSLAGHETWSRRFASDAAAPTYSYADASEDSRMGYENRFIFSTDPALRAISGN